MMKTMIKTAGAASLLALAVAGNSAMAAPLDQLGFSQHAGFGTPVFPAGPGGPLVFDTATANTDPLAAPNTNSSFSWKGDEDDLDRSSIEITSFSNSGPGPNTAVGGANDASPLTDIGGAALRLVGATSIGGAVTGGVQDNDGKWNEGDWWVIDTLTQTNNELTSRGGTYSPPLWRVDAIANLRFYADADRTQLAYADPTTFSSIEFDETVNTGTVAGCGLNNLLGTRCDDVFTVAASVLAPVSFTIGQYRYDISFGLLAGDSTESGSVVGKSLIVPNADGTISVYTPETRPGTSSIHVAMSYDATFIPEPSVLGLFGAGVLALGFVGRRRRKASC